MTEIERIIKPYIFIGSRDECAKAIEQYVDKARIEEHKQLCPQCCINKGKDLKKWHSKCERIAELKKGLK